MPEKAEKAQYSSREAPSLKTTLRFTSGGNSVSQEIKFKNGLFETGDPDLIKALDEAIEKSINFRQLVTKLDRDAALKIAEEHRKRKAEQARAVKGGMTSDAAKMASRENQYDQILKVVGDPEKAEELVKQLRNEEDFTVTDSEKTGADTPDDGFIQNAKPALSDETKEIPVREGSEEEAKSAKELANENAVPPKTPFAKKGK